MRITPGLRDSASVAGNGSEEWSDSMMGRHCRLANSSREKLPVRIASGPPWRAAKPNTEALSDAVRADSAVAYDILELS